MEKLRKKLAIAERTAKSEAQLKEKYQLRLKVAEEELRVSSGGSNGTTPEGTSVSNGPGFSSKRTPTSQMKHAKGKSKSLNKGKDRFNGIVPNYSLKKSSDGTTDSETRSPLKGNCDEKPSEDCVSGLSCDVLQNEVIALRKAGHEKDQSLRDKDYAIAMLAKKVDTLTKAMEVEAKTMRRKVADMEKQVAAMRVEKEQDIRANGRTRRLYNAHQLLDPAWYN